MNSPKQATPDYPIQQLIARRWRPYVFADRPVSDDDLRFDEDDSSGADPGRGSLMDRSDRTGRTNQVLRFLSLRGNPVRQYGEGPTAGAVGQATHAKGACSR
jgi:hypothetical protein